MKFNAMLKQAKIALKVKSPQIKMAFAAVGVVGGVVWACKATLKAKAIVDKYKDEKAVIEASSGSEGVSENGHPNGLAKRNLILIKDLGICYAGPIALIGGSMYLGFSGFNEMKSMYVGATALAAGFRDKLEKYRGKVAEKIGVNEEADLYHGVTYKDIHTQDENGLDQIIKKAPVMEDDVLSPMAVLFCDRDPDTKIGSKYFNNKRNDLNLLFLKNAQINANMKLGQNGVMTVYEVLTDYLGMDIQSLRPEIRENAFTWGWRYTPDNSDSSSDNYIDFGVWDAYWRLKNDESLDFGQFFAKDIFLDFNAVPLFYIDHSKTNKLAEVCSE